MSEDHVVIDYDKWLHEQRRSTAERHHEHEWQVAEQASSAAISSAQITLRTLIIVNGGAAITMLAFAGNLLNSDDVEINAVKALTGPLWWFSFGVAIAILAMALAYFTIYCAATSLNNRKHSYDHPYSEDTPSSRSWRRWSDVFQVLAVLVGLVSLYFFVHGMLVASAAIVALS